MMSDNFEELHWFCSESGDREAFVYYDNKEDRAIEAIPGPEDQHTKCRKVTMREWDRGNLVSEKVEEVCEGEKVSRYY